MIFSENFLSVENFLEWKWALKLAKENSISCTGLYFPGIIFLSLRRVKGYHVKRCCYVYGLTSKMEFRPRQIIPQLRKKVKKTSAIKEIGFVFS
jgi:hypothetical protein